MKGNLLTAIQGVEAIAEANGGTPPINVKFIFEGEEEIGSPNLRDVVRNNKDRLAADAVISADGGQFGFETPSLTVGLKGLGGCQVNLRTANTDLHSGMYGAKVPNAVQSMVQLAATFHDSDGRIAVDGFYDNVVDLTGAERAEIALVAEDEEALKAELGIDSLWGEPGWTAREREWGRPTLDLNGIWGGFQGDGIKTVTPSEAHLKITCRLVPNQTPEGVVELIRAHVVKHRPPGATVEVVRLPGSATPFAIDRGNPVHRAAEAVLTDLFGIPTGDHPKRRHDSCDGYFPGRVGNRHGELCLGHARQRSARPQRVVSRGRFQSRPGRLCRADRIPREARRPATGLTAVTFWYNRHEDWQLMPFFVPVVR